MDEDSRWLLMPISSRMTINDLRALIYSMPMAMRVKAMERGSSQVHRGYAPGSLG